MAPQLAHRLHCTTPKTHRGYRITCAAQADACRLFVFGLGYTGVGLVRQLQRQGGWHCSGSCRAQDKAAALAESGVQAHVYDPDNLRFLSPLALKDLHQSTHILSTVAPNGDFDKDQVCVATLHVSMTATYFSRDSCRATEVTWQRPAHCTPGNTFSYEVSLAGAPRPLWRPEGTGGGRVGALARLCEQHERVRRLGRRLG